MTTEIDMGRQFELFQWTQKVKAYSREQLEQVAIELYKEWFNLHDHIQAKDKVWMQLIEGPRS